MANNSIMDYGIAVNFFGNYQREGKDIQNINESIYNGFVRLKQLALGGSIAYAFKSLGSSIYNTARSMEQNFSTLSASLGSVSDALKNLEWARIKGAKTAFGIEEVNSAVAMMTSMGFNKNDAQRETTFNSIGDFAGLKGFGFADMMQRVAKAGFGNWESLGDQFGIRRQTIGGMVRERVGRTPQTFSSEMDEINKAIQIVEKGTAGTEEYRNSIVKLIGVLGRGGMEQRLNTIGGAISNIDDIFRNFMYNMVGYTQVQGTLANTIKNSIVENILKPFTENHRNSASSIGEMVTSVDQLGNIGKSVGQILITVWGGFSDILGSTSNTIVSWIDKLDKYFSDFKNNVAPIILFIYLIRLEVEEFVKGFADGFKTAFGFFYILIKNSISLLITFLDWLNITSISSEGLGKVLGYVVGSLAGIKAFTFVSSLFNPLLKGGGQVLKMLDSLILRQRIFNGLTRMADGNVTSGLTLLKGAFARLGREGLIIAEMFRMVTAGSWAFNASLLANPITWIVVAVVALVAWLGYLIYNWEEVGNKMQNVSDIGLALLAMFLPIIGVPLILAKYWDGFKNIFSNIWDGMKFKVMSWWLTLKFEVFVPLMSLGAKVWNGLKMLAMSFLAYTLMKFPVLITVFETMRNVWDNIKSGFSSVWSFVEKIYNKLTDNTFISSIVKIGEKISEWFSDSSEMDYKEKLKKYDPAEYERLYGSKVEKVTAPKSSPSTTNNTTDASSTTTVSGNTIIMPKGTDGNNFLQQLKDNTKKKGK